MDVTLPEFEEVDFFPKAYYENMSTNSSPVRTVMNSPENILKPNTYTVSDMVASDLARRMFDSEPKSMLPILSQYQSTAGNVLHGAGKVDL